LFLTFFSKIIVFWSVTPHIPSRSVDVQTGVWQTIAGVVGPNKRLKRPHIFEVTLRLWPHYDWGTRVVRFWKQMTLRTYLSAGYCTLFAVLGCWRRERKGCTKDWWRSKYTGHYDAHRCVFFSIVNIDVLEESAN